MLRDFLCHDLDRLWRKIAVFRKIDLASKKGPEKIDQIALEVYCAKNGYLSILKTMGDMKTIFLWKLIICEEAAVDGHLDVIKWARSMGASWGRTMWEALVNGHLEVIVWAHSVGADWPVNTCSTAAAKGHLKILQYARANGAVWNESTATNAALNGHLEILQWAVANGAPLEKQAYQCAVWKKHRKVIYWLKASKAPGST